jgi:hypothetical protein
MNAKQIRKGLFSMPELLRPVKPEQVDPRLAIHLAAGETVLWQNQPKSGSFFGPSQILGAFALIIGGILVATGMVGPALSNTSRYVPAAVAVALGIFFLISRWRNRAEFWIYAITDRRLLSILRNKVIRSVTPDQLDRYQLRISGDTVYWLQPAVNNRGINSGTKKGPDGSLIGFHGQPDAQATKSLIQNWRQGISAGASTEAAAFVKTMSATTVSGCAAGISSPPVGVTRISHPATGLCLDVMSDWQVTVRARTDGPLKLFGMTLLPRIIRDGPERPYGDGAEWNMLSVRGAPEAGLDLTICDKPLALTLDAVLNDPFTKITGTEILDSTPDLRVGPFVGFSVIRQMSAGAQIKNVPSLSATALLHQVWLNHAGSSLEIIGYALESQTEVQDAIDAMIASIKIAP